jgi:mannose-6-phosphate isomerase-like protein (cupin superfamily)
MTDLLKLNDAVRELIKRPATHDLIDNLKRQLQNTPEPFVWSTIDLESITTPIPEAIKSCWVFVLKQDVPSGCHYHPNSIQHMVTVEGEGTSRVGGVSRQMRRLDEPDYSLDDIWYVIPAGVPHEFFPTGAAVVVVSFHTCESEALEEISCDSGATRIYEPQLNANLG